MGHKHRLDLVVLDFAIMNSLLLGVVIMDFANILPSRVFLGSLLFYNAAWLVIAQLQRIYKWRERVRLLKELEPVALAVLSHFALFGFAHHYFFSQIFPYGLVVNNSFLLFFLMVFSRVFLRAFFGAKQEPFNYIVVGGKGTNVQHILRSFAYAYSGKANCLGRFGNSQHDFIGRLGGYNDIRTYVENAINLQKVFYVYSDLSNDEVREIMFICQTKFIDFEIIPREVDLFPRGVNVEFYDDLPIINLKEEPLFRLRNKILKRVFDILFSGLVLLLVFPWLLPIIALLIRLESKGPIFFIQDRSGYLGNLFPCFKFRTMTVNSESGSRQATKDDTRITKIGAFLRKTSLDEFPQFINVFLGDMSVVGPRPHMQKHTEEYSKLISSYMIRHKIKPGITGWAQVNGYRGPTETLDKMEKRVEYDVWYIENWTFWLDIKCVVLTVLNAVKGEENAI